jgi:hypothetical protein
VKVITTKVPENINNIILPKSPYLTSIKKNFAQIGSVRNGLPKIYDIINI